MFSPVLTDVSLSDAVTDRRVTDMSLSDALMDRRVTDVSLSDIVTDGRVTDMSSSDAVSNRHSSLILHSDGEEGPSSPENGKQLLAWTVGIHSS